jgi:hypothetical protein
MTEWVAFLLPPATALAGMRLTRLACGPTLQARHGFGLRFAVGLAVGMLVFSQALLLAVLAGVDASRPLAVLALVWGAVEAALLAPRLADTPLRTPLRPRHLWLLLLGPALYAAWVFGRLSVLEGTLEFDATAFWVFKAKILYLEQGRSFLAWMHQPDLAYAHWDYPLLVPGLYALGYGAMGRVDEFVNKVWPFWMLAALCLGILSLAEIRSRPRPLPILTASVVCFLPASLHFVRQEGGTLPMAFFASLSALLLVTGWLREDDAALSAAVLVLAGGAATKFEGIVFAGCWAAAWPGLRRKWRSHGRVGRSLAVAILCLLPYVIFRLAGPVPHPESDWWRTGLASPGGTLRRLPQLVLVGVVGRFFSQGFFLWGSVDHDHLQWIGRWNGLRSLVNPELSVLPWLLAAVLAVDLRWVPGHRGVLVALSGSVVGVLGVLCLAMACLPMMQADVLLVIDYGRDVVGRYCYPFFLAWFLGIMAPWLTPVDAPVTADDATRDAS